MVFSGFFKTLLKPIIIGYLYFFYVIWPGQLFFDLSTATFSPEKLKFWPNLTFQHQIFNISTNFDLKTKI